MSAVGLTTPKLVARERLRGSALWCPPHGLADAHALAVCGVGGTARGNDRAAIFRVWLNRRHRRVGHLFQGRFQSDVIQEDVGVGKQLERGNLKGQIKRMKEGLSNNEM